MKTIKFHSFWLIAVNHLHFILCQHGAVWHGCLCIMIHLMKGEWMEDTEAGHNSTFCLLPTVYFSQNSNCNNYSDNKV